jgi:hypothetical protein
MDKQEINWTEYTVPGKILSIGTIKPDYNISFHNNGQQIGKLDFNGPEMVFTGDAEESAKVFIDWVAQSFAARLEEERKAAQLAVPDAIHHTELSETLEYIQGWNDCRAEMLKEMKS